MNGLPRSEPRRFQGKRIFITGGTGFVGRSLLDYLGESAQWHGADFQADVLTRSPAAFLTRFPEYAGIPWLKFIEGDLACLPALTARYSDVVHAAADTHRTDDPLQWLDQLIQGTRHVLDFACRAQARRLAFISSGAVYGPQGADAIGEDARLAPLPTDVHSVYAQGKRIAEHLCALYSSAGRIDCVIARCFAIISRHVPMEGPYAAGNFLRDALDPRCAEICIQGDGSAVRTYLDGRDMAHWVFTLLANGRGGEAYNVGSDSPISVLELAKLIGEEIAPHKPVARAGAPVNSARSVYVPCVRKAHALGLTPETPLRQAVRAAALR
jgi:nucleoside-diphosphate-sugar epimerase